MKLSTRTRYAVRALVDLGVNYKGRPIQIKDIAKRQKLSVRYLENLFTVLRAGGILISEKGHGGGFSLAKNPKNINILEVVELVEGKISLVDCLVNYTICDNIPTCVTHDIWREINDTIIANLKKITLKSLIEKYYKINPQKNMYYI